MNINGHGMLSARQWQLPTNLESYKVSLPQSLLPHRACVGGQNKGIYAQKAQLLSLQAKSVCKVDQPHVERTSFPHLLSLGAADEVEQVEYGITN